MKNKKGFALLYQHILIPRLATLFVITAIVLLNASCGNIKQLQYLQGDIDTVAFKNINFIEPVIQKGDIISITVYSDNQLASAVYNQSGGATPTLSSPTGSASASGYLVNEEGNIQLFELGLVKVEGMTKKQLADLLVGQYVQRNLLKNPFVEVRFVNFKVTIIGDVNNPGVYSFPNEKVNVFDAIGMAGDLSNFAKRDNILIVREVDGVRRFSRLDLTNPNVFNSPYFYLRQNDMIVVDPTKVKATVNDQTFRYLAIVTSIVSTVALLYSIFR